MELTAEQLDTITCNAEDHGGTVTDYSGRGMYGRHCFAITVDGPPTVFALRFGSALGDADADLARELGEEPLNTDSLGLGYVIYWPNVTAPQPVEDACRCGAPIRADGHGSWLDPTGGDGCSGPPDAVADTGPVAAWRDLVGLGVHAPEAIVDT